MNLPDQQSSGPSRRLLRWLGHLLSLLALGYVFWLLLAGTRDIADHGFSHDLLLTCLVAAALYVLASAALGLAWFLLLRSAGGDQVPLRTAWHMHGASQLAKYLPGNVFHLAGRHHLGRLAGVSHGRLVAAAVLEAAGLMAVAAALALAFASGIELAVPVSIKLEPRWLAGAMVLAALLLLAWQLRSNGARATLPILGSWACYTLFFCMVGAAGLHVLLVISPDVGWGDLPMFIGAYALAWAVGFIVPGAPGGLGVREAALVALLPSLQAAPAELALFALLFRVVSMIGDVGYFALAYLFRPGAGNGLVPRAP